MRNYDKNLPLIFLHIPKTAGVSVRKIFKKWYGPRLLPHYHDGKSPPNKRDITSDLQRNRQTILYGHFNGGRGFGADQYYPEVQQFITILRDPWEREVSAYFYIRKENVENGAFSELADLTMEEFLMRPSGIVNHFPKGCNMHTFRDVIERYFVEIGIVEKLEESLNRIAGKLGFNFNDSELDTLNATPRYRSAPENLKDEFRAIRSFDYALYDYVWSKYN